jgi:long-chain acyl-CoA synthetase
MTTQPDELTVAKERAEIEAEIAGGTLLTAYEQTVSAHPDTVSHRWKDDAGQWHELTYAQVREQVRLLALGLVAHGVRKGDFVLIWSHNRSEAIIADFAVMHAGAIPVVIYQTTAPEQAAYIATHCAATAVIAEDTATLARLASVADQFRLSIVIDNNTEGAIPSGHCVPWDAVIAAGRESTEDFDKLWRRIGPDDLATLIYTSGTTGTPKGVMITHHSVRFYIQATHRALPAEDRGDEDGIRLISYLPLAHVTGRAVDVWTPMFEPATVTFCPDYLKIFEYAASVHPTVLVGVPRVWEKLQAGLRAAVPTHPRELTPDVRQAILTHIGLDKCQLAVTGAAPIDPDICEYFQALGVPFTEGWGMSELTCAAAISHPQAPRNGTVGRAYPGMEITLADDGEVLVRGPMLMAGYYRDPEQTSATIDADGWLHTGDIGTMDDEGYLRITDRKKELIINASGKNISPALIEYQLQRHPLIGQACAFGDRRSYITALLVLDPDAIPAWAKANGVEPSGDLTTNPAMLAEVGRAVDEANSHLARVEQVKRWKLLPGEWTAESGDLTPTLKKRRRVIAERYATEIESLYT